MHSFGLSVTAHRAAMLAEPTERERYANAWMGDQDVVEVLFGTGRLEGGAVEALRSEPPGFGYYEDLKATSAEALRKQLTELYGIL